MSPLDMEPTSQRSASDATPATSPKRGLMSLPRELRDMIYEQASLDMTFNNKGEMIIPPLPISSDGTKAHPPNNGLLLASKEISTEAQEVVYGLLSFNITENYLHPAQRSNIWTFLTQTRPENKARVTKLALDWDHGLNAVPNRPAVSEIQARHFDVWARDCSSKSWAWNGVHTAECDAAHEGTIRDLDESFPLVARATNHILASLRVLSTFGGLQKLALAFPSPGCGWDAEGTLRLCFQECPFFGAHFEEIVEAVRGVTGVRRLKLHHVEDLEKVEALAEAMGVWEVVVEYRVRDGWPMPERELPPGWYRDPRSGDYLWVNGLKLRKWMRPWAGGKLVAKKVVYS